jgi:WD40 repeat protein
LSRIEWKRAVPVDEHNRIDIWTRDGQLRRRVPVQKGAVPEEVAFAPDGALFAVRFYRRGAVVYDSMGNYHSLLNTQLRQPKSVEFSADGRHLLATYGNHSVRIFDRRGNPVVLLNQHQDTVTHAAFAPDGRSVLTVAGDVAKLFSLRGQLLAEFDRHDGPVRSAFFTADGRFVVTLDQEGTVRRYPLPSRIYAWLNGAGRLPQISTEERQRYGLTEFDLEIEDQ